MIIREISRYYILYFLTDLLFCQFSDYATLAFISGTEILHSW